MRLPFFTGGPFGAAVLALGVIALVGSSVQAQTTDAQAPAESSDGGPTVGDSRVGYIDCAIPGNQFRLRFDAAYNDTRPTRAEFFYARSAPLGPGLPLPETKVDYQDLSTYIEKGLAERLSAFIEVPVRFLNPEINRNATGIGDMNTGFKYAFISTADLVTTFQLRTYIPTGDSTRGLGNDHASLEPAILVFKELADRLGLESELRYWVPLGGTSFAGDIIRYGVGLNYDLWRTDLIDVAPVAEIVGWTVLSGKESSLLPSNGAVFVQSAAGDTIINAKMGVRFKFDRGDFYAGYGRALTGDRWYDDIVRLEFRLFY